MNNEDTNTKVTTVTPGTISKTDFTEVTSKYMEAVKATSEKVKKRKELVAELEDLIMENSDVVYEGGSYHKYALRIRVLKEPEKADERSEEMEKIAPFWGWFVAPLRDLRLNAVVKEKFPEVLKFAEEVEEVFADEEGRFDRTPKSNIDEEATKVKRKEYMAKVNELRTIENELEAADLTKKELRGYISLFKDIKDLVVEDYDDEDYED